MSNALMVDDVMYPASKEFLKVFFRGLSEEDMYIIVRSMAHGADVVRMVEQEYNQAVSDRIQYHQCAYGL